MFSFLIFPVKREQVRVPAILASQKLMTCRELKHVQSKRTFYVKRKSRAYTSGGTTGTSYPDPRGIVVRGMKARTLSFL